MSLTNTKSDIKRSLNLFVIGKDFEGLGCFGGLNRSQTARFKARAPINATGLAFA